MTGSGVEGDYGRFLAAAPASAYPDCPFALLGVPLDVSGTFRPGTRFGPARVRFVSHGLEEYDPHTDRDLADLAFCDLGDVPLPFGDLTGSLARIQEAVASLARDGKKFVLLGGEHSLTPPAVRAAAEVWPDLGVIQFDAHMDLRDDYLGVREGHASAMRGVVDALGPGCLAQVGIRSGTREEFALARRWGTWFPGDPLDAVKGALHRLGNRPLYVSVDVDVLDPAVAPGVGTPEPGGWTFGQLWEALRWVLREGHVVAMDVVELCPPCDSADITAVAVAKLVRDALLTMSKGRG